MRRLVSVLLAGFLAVAGLAVAPGAVAAPVCTATSGVLVVVDFGPLGGGVVRRCLAAVPDTGYDALHAAGFSTAGTVHDGPGFVCRIDNRPGPAAQPCTDTPTGSAYWAYWEGDARGNQWHYSTEGAMSSTPRAGQVEGWSFGAGRTPAAAVSALLARPGAPGRGGGPGGPPAAPAPGQPVTGAGAGNGAGGAPGAPGGAAAPAPGRPGATGGAAPGGPGKPGGPGGPRPSGAASAPVDVAAAPQSPATEPTAGTVAGFPTLSVVVFVLIWVLGIVAALLVRRRRRRNSS